MNDRIVTHHMHCQVPGCKNDHSSHAHGGAGDCLVSGCSCRGCECPGCVYAHPERAEGRILAERRAQEAKDAAALEARIRRLRPIY